LVDDDTKFRTLLRTTFEAVDVEVDEAADAAEAEARAAGQRPDVIVLDVGLPGVDGIELCRRFKNRRATEDIRVVLLTGREDVEGEAARAGADALLLKPFRPLELLTVVERLAAGQPAMPLRTVRARSEEEQLLLYARDLRRLLEVERAQRVMLKSAYEETISAFAGALEVKDFGTGAHSKRVVRYARELTRTLEASLLEDPSLEYGFLLHDVGKIGIPDWILQKPGALTREERRLMRTHTLVGSQLLANVPLLQGQGLSVIRSHHERWDGSGYPDGLRKEEIPLGARIFAVADALDAITNHRPYREARSWRDSKREIVAQAGKQFDPQVVEAFCDREHVLHEIRREFLAAA
jgi:ribonuclease P protein subunit RPR2